MSTSKHTPADHVRLGAISAAIWANETDNGTRYGVTFERLYRDQQSSDWKSSSTFNRDDLLTLGKVADMAHTRIHELQSSERAASKANGSDSTPNTAAKQQAGAANAR